MELKKKYKSDHSILELKKWPQQNFYFTVSSVVRVFHVYQSITGNDKVNCLAKYFKLAMVNHGQTVPTNNGSKPNAHKLFVHTSDLGWQEEEQRSHTNNLCESRHYRKSRNFHFNFVVERKNEKYKCELIID